MRRGAVVVFVVVLPFLAFGWHNFFDLGGGLDDGRDVAVCADGGFFVTGRSNGWAYGTYRHNWYDHDAFLIKLSPGGTVEWINHYGQNGWFIYGGDTMGYYDAGWSVYATADSGAIIVGKTQSPNYTEPFHGFPDNCIGYDNMLVVRVDKNGDTLWTTSYGGYYFDRAWFVTQVPNVDEEQFYVVGPTQNFGPDMPSTDWENIWVLKIDSEGNVLDTGLWADPTRQGHSDVRWGCIGPDNCLVLAGGTDMHDTTYVDSTDATITRRITNLVVVKFDTALNVVWSTVMGRGYDHYCRSIAPHPDGGYIVLTYDKYPAESWALYFNEDGDTVWTKNMKYDDDGNYLGGWRMVVPGPDSGFYFAGGGDGAARILYTDKNLRPRWLYVMDFGSYSEYFNSCKMTPDSGCIAAGETYSYYPIYYTDVFVARVDRNGNEVADVKEGYIVKYPWQLTLVASPNPFNSACEITVSADADVEIYDVEGRLVYKNRSPYIGEHSGIRYITWSPDASVPSGAYLIRAVNSNGQSITKKVIYLK